MALSHSHIRHVYSDLADHLPITQKGQLHSVLVPCLPFSASKPASAGNTGAPDSTVTANVAEPTHAGQEVCDHLYSTSVSPLPRFSSPVDNNCQTSPTHAGQENSDKLSSTLSPLPFTLSPADNNRQTSPTCLNLCKGANDLASTCTPVVNIPIDPSAQASSLFVPSPTHVTDFTLASSAICSNFLSLSTPPPPVPLLHTLSTADDNSQ